MLAMEETCQIMIADIEAGGRIEKVRQSAPRYAFSFPTVVFYIHGLIRRLHGVVDVLILLKSSVASCSSSDGTRKVSGECR